MQRTFLEFSVLLDIMHQQKWI